MSQYQKWRGHAEIVLENYHRNRLWLKEIETQAIYGNDKEPGLPRGSDVSDPTQSAAMQLLQNRVQQARREVDAVDRVRKQIRNKEALSTLLSMVWIDRRCRLYQAAELMDISYRTASRYKRTICTMLAKELGWI